MPMLCSTLIGRRVESMPDDNTADASGALHEHGANAQEPNVAGGSSPAAHGPGGIGEGPDVAAKAASTASLAAAPKVNIPSTDGAAGVHESPGAKASPHTTIAMPSPAPTAHSAVAGRLAAVRASAVGLRPPKNAAVVRLVGAPTLDIVEAKRQLMEDQQLAESPEMAELSQSLAAAADTGAAGSPAEADVLDTANEETFTLETFEALIRTARAAEKTFLVARVTTVDPRDLTRLFYSHYSAYQINKVIFRTQPEEGLLHRMKSRNPLNNMLIVGDVHYFAVTPEEFDRAWAAHMVGEGGAAGMRPDVNLSSFSVASYHSSAGAPPVVYEAKFFATDDDFLMRTDVREFFRRNSVLPDDYQLFQLHRRADTAAGNNYEMAILGADGRPLLHGTQHAAVDDAARPSRLRTLCGLLDGGRHRNLVGWPTGWLSPLGFWVLMVIATVTVVVVGLLVLPAPTQYFAFGGLAGFFCIVLLFLVDWTDGR